MGLLSLAIWTPILFGVVLLALGRESQVRAVRWLALIGAIAGLLVTLPLTNNLPLAALIVGAPAIGGALFVVDKLLGKQVARFASVQYSIQGPWTDPKITFDKPFEKN